MPVWTLARSFEIGLHKSNEEHLTYVIMFNLKYADTARLGRCKQNGDLHGAATCGAGRTLHTSLERWSTLVVYSSARTGGETLTVGCTIVSFSASMLANVSVKS